MCMKGSLVVTNPQRTNSAVPLRLTELSSSSLFWFYDRNFTVLKSQCSHQPLPDAAGTVAKKL